MGFYIYEMSVNDALRERPNNAIATGGAVLVVGTANCRKVTLYNPDTFVALTNPVTFTRGKIRFATLDTIPEVSIYGFAPTGHAIAERGVKPGAEGEFNLATRERVQVAQIPVYSTDYTAASENDTGLDFPVGALLLPQAAVRVTAVDATETVDFGLLASESGGDADGLIAAADVATLGTVVATLTTASPTAGALLRLNIATTPAVNLPRPHAIGTARSISVTPSAGSDTGEFFLIQPYILPAL